MKRVPLRPSRARSAPERKRRMSIARTMTSRRPRRAPQRKRRPLPSPRRQRRCRYEDRTRSGRRRALNIERTTDGSDMFIVSLSHTHLLLLPYYTRSLLPSSHVVCCSSYSMSQNSPPPPTTTSLYSRRNCDYPGVSVLSCAASCRRTLDMAGKVRNRAEGVLGAGI